MWTTTADSRSRLGSRCFQYVLTLGMASALLLALPVQEAQAVGPYDGAPTAVSVVGANNVGQKDIPANLTEHTNVVKDVSAGGDHALAVDDFGRLYAWGDNSTGEGFIYVPQQKLGYKAVSAGNNYSLAINANGQVEAWGSDAYGLTTIPSSLSGKNVTAISAGAGLALALDDSGRVHAWGDNFFGQLDIPQALYSKRVVKIAAGAAFAVAVTEDKQVFAWGQDWSGQTTVPASLQGRTIEEIDAGFAHAVALLSDGSIIAWGDNTHGQLATPTTSARWQHISAGPDYTAATSSQDLTIKVWGEGATTTFANLPPTRIPVSRLTAGGNFVAYGEAFVVPTDPPSIQGTGRVGEPLTGIFGTYRPVQPTGKLGGWWLGSQHLAQGTAYTPAPDQVGKTLIFDVIASRDGYVYQTVSDQVTVLPGLMVKDQPRPTVSGFAQVGKVLAATASFSPAPDRIQYDWHVDGQFKLATDDGRYTVQPEDLGHRITVHATAIKAGYDAAASGFSEPTASVTQTPRLAVLSAPAVTGDARVGREVTVTPPTSEPAATSIAYQWMRGDVPIAGATANRYVPTPEDRGRQLWVDSTLRRDGYDDATSASPAVLVGAGGFTEVRVPVIEGTAVIGSVLRTTVTSTPAPEATKVEWYAGDVLRASGSATYEVTRADLGSRLTVKVHVMRNGYDTVTSTSLPTVSVAKARPVVKAKAAVRAGQTVLKVRASAAGLPPLSAGLTVRVGKTVVRAKLVAGHAVIKLPRTRRPLTVKLAPTATTSAVTLKIEGAK